MAVNPLLVGGGIVATAAVVGGGLYAGGVFGGTSATQVPPPNATQDDVIKAKWHSLSEDNDYLENSEVTAAYKDKYGQTYSRFLIGVTTKDKSKPETSNNAWWQEVHTKRYLKNKQAAKDGFANLDTWTALMNACKEAYGANAETETVDGVLKLKVVKAGPGNTNPKYFKEDDFWTFCSSGKTKIKTLKNMESEKNGYGNENTSYARKAGNDAKLVSIQDPGAKWFWDLKQDEIKTATDIDSNTESEFKKLKEKLNGSGQKDPNADTVKEICKQAYSQVADTSQTNYPKEHVGKFCTLDGKALS